MNKCKVYIYCIVETSLKLSQFKFGENNTMNSFLENNTLFKCKKFDTHNEERIGWLMNSLLEHNTSFKYDKFGAYHEEGNGQFKFLYYMILLYHITRDRVTNALIIVNLIDDKVKEIYITNINDIDNTFAHIMIPTFDIYH